MVLEAAQLLRGTKNFGGKICFKVGKLQGSVIEPFSFSNLQLSTNSVLLGVRKN